MTQPSVRAVQKLTRASAALALCGQRSAVSGHSPCLLKRVLPPVGCCVKRGSTSGSQGGGAGRNVVSVSSILLQDGLEIQELPILVRLLDKGALPLASHTYPGEHVRPMSAEDQDFHFLLQQCLSVRDVFKLLEIPSERVTGYSASAALQRLCELQKMNADWDDLHSFIRTAVMKELNDTVRKDVGQLSNETLVSLVSCYMNMDSFGQECLSAINGEIEKRMVEEQFSIENLCAVSKLLHISGKGDRDLINSIWVHIANHYQDVDERCMARVLESLPPSHRYVLKVLGRQVQRVWWKMKEEDAVACLNALVQHNSLQVSIMTHFSHWLFLNIHTVSERNLMQFVAAFIHFRFSDAKFITAVERYVGAGGEKLSANLLGLVMEYCRMRRYFSPTILDAAARHFVQHGHSYSALQMFTILRPFGQLNYLPKDSHQFLLQTERMLKQRFDDFHPAHLAELLCSFAFVEKIPLNFVQKVLTPSFLSRVKGLDRSDEVGVWLEMLQSAVKLETRGVRVPYLYKKQCGTEWKDERMWMLQSKLEETLGRMFSRLAVKAHTFAPNTVYIIDAEMHLSEEGRPVAVNYQGGQVSPQVATRLAMLIMGVDHYCVNSGHLMGKFAMRRRHLRKLGYTVVEVFDAEFLPLTRPQREQYIADKLRKWVHQDCLTGFTKTECFHR
ncbi:FAST kinase domain-containing protein 3, mitochondrial-like [Babylonia areolata]|uniref:FAST kinase domain-containing protein 3, mitochondrial-like n=1 Tax=Babylonia areolata TaxID=304850 RepID=UPI003FD5F62B